MIFHPAGNNRLLSDIGLMIVSFANAAGDGHVEGGNRAAHRRADCAHRQHWLALAGLTKHNPRRGALPPTPTSPPKRRGGVEFRFESHVCVERAGQEERRVRAFVL